MSTMTHPIQRSSLPARGALVVLFWILAAAPVVGAHTLFDGMMPAGAVAVKIAAIVGAAWLYTRLCARDCTVDSALLVGITWLMLDIAAEIATTRYLGRGWFDLIGAPEKTALRDLLLLTWVIAPALFARMPAQR